MNENQNQEFNGEEVWQDSSYTSTRTMGDSQELMSRVATKSLMVTFIGLIVTTIVAYLTCSNISFMVELVLSGAYTFLIIAELVVVLVNSWAISKKNIALAGVMFGVYSIINGLTLSVVLFAYEIGTVQEAFLMTAIVFGVMAAYGYFTKKDLSSIGSICTMALLGVILVSLLNAFVFKSSGMDLMLDYIVVLLFVGITAFDMYRMKQMALAGGEEEVNRIALFTGMQLYLDFINIFLRLIRIMGRNSRN